MQMTRVMHTYLHCIAAAAWCEGLFSDLCRLISVHGEHVPGQLVGCARGLAQFRSYSAGHVYL